MRDEIVGREREFSAAEEFLVDLRDGPSALVFEGEAGIGKTTVWNAAVRLALDSGSTVLSCRPAQSEADLSFSSLTDLLAGVEDGATSELPLPQHRALDAALLRADPDGAAPDQRAVSAAVLTTLVTLAQKRTVVIAIDDAQWLDPPTQRVLEYVARRLSSSSVGFLVAVRAFRQASVTLALHRAMSDARFRLLRLGPLSRGALRHLLRASAPLPLSGAVMAQIERDSGGNPFYALELVRQLREGEPTLGHLSLPDSLAALVSDRIQRLPAASRAVLLVVSALSRPTVAVVERASPGGARRLTKAVDAGVVTLEGDSIRFVHPLFRSAVYSSASRDERRRVHLGLADIVIDPEEHARHLALAADGADEHVASALDRAADQARSRGAPDAAAELVERAIELTPPTGIEDRWRRMVQAADDHLHAGNRTRPRELLELVTRQRPAGPMRAAALRLLAEVRFSDDSYTAAFALLDEALAQAGEAVLLRVRIEIDLAFVLVNNGNMPLAAVHANSALGLAERAGEPGLLGEALAAAAGVDLLIGLGLDDVKVERALALEDWDRTTVFFFRPTFGALWTLTVVGQLERAQAAWDLLRENLVVRGGQADLPNVSFWATWLETWRGEIASATRIAETAVADSVDLESRVMRSAALSARAMAYAYGGRIEEGRQDGEAAMALAQDAAWVNGMAWAASALGFLALSAGDPAGADLALGAIAEAVVKMGLREPASAPFVPDEIEASIALGHLEQAETLLAWLEERGRALDRAWALAAAGRCRALMLAAQGDLGGALVVLEGALAEHARLPMPFELARTLLVKGRLQRRRRERLAAHETLGRALEIFKALGAPLWARQAADEIARIGLRGPAAPGLTPTEWRVAELAASGLTNREVAAAAFMSPKTVEANLSHIYDKLGIRSRAELGARIAADRDRPKN